jgi:soluble lytic murein transglycosylase-like protein
MKLAVFGLIAALVLPVAAPLAGTYPVTAECVVQAARLQGIPPEIILGLLKTEGGHLGSESPNRNGSYDLGPMQVNNRVWVPKLARLHFGGDERAAYAALRDHGCYSIHIGAWIFRQYLQEAGGNYGEAIGLYNSHTEGPKRAYQARFAANFRQLFGGMLGVRR